MRKPEVDEIKRRYNIDLGSIDFDAMWWAERLQWSQKIIKLQRRLINDRFYEVFDSPVFDCRRAYRNL